MNYIFILLLNSFILFGCAKTKETPSLEKPSKALQLISAAKTNVPEPSGLAYNFNRNTLFTVSDGNSTIYEINTSGEVLSSAQVSCIDLEGIALSENCDTIYVVDETSHSITKFTSDYKLISVIPTNISSKKNKSLEGITIDRENHIWVINEKDPCLLVEFNIEKEVSRKELHFSKDLSDIYFDSQCNCLWVLSDESEKVMKLSMTGNLIDEYSLPFTKGEGITIVGDKIYVINDSDSKLYVFKKP